MREEVCGACVICVARVACVIAAVGFVEFWGIVSLLIVNRPYYDCALGDLTRRPYGRLCVCVCVSKAAC